MVLSLDESLYVAWLVPSSLSFVSSCAVIYYILVRRPSLRSQLFHKLTVQLALSDLIQSGCWFIGVKYSAHYHQCAVQEYLLQLGLALRASVSVVICSVAMFVVQTHSQPTTRRVTQFNILLILIPCALLVVSVTENSARLYCNVEIPQYNESSTTTKRAILAYWLITVYIYLCALVNAILLSSMEMSLGKIRQNLRHHSSVSVVTSHQQEDGTGESGGRQVSVAPSRTAPSINNKMMVLVNRLRIYPLIFVVLWIPEIIALLTILITGTDQLILRHIANFSGGCIGLITSLSYFYHQKHQNQSSSSTTATSSSRSRRLSSSSPLRGSSRSRSSTCNNSGHSEDEAVNKDNNKSKEQQSIGKERQSKESDNNDEDSQVSTTTTRNNNNNNDDDDERTSSATTVSVEMRSVSTLSPLH